jgi:hypothetical protein
MNKQLKVNRISGLSAEMQKSIYERSEISCSTYSLKKAIKYAKQWAGKDEVVEEYALNVLMHEYNLHCAKQAKAEKYRELKVYEDFCKAKLQSEKLLNI